jgi:ubiquinone/menaquinone biosynthesis C-methylase UbiE
MSSRSHHRIDSFGKVAPYYDTVLDLITFGMYARFLRRAIEILAPKKGEKILDLCSGTGRAASWVAQEVGKDGEVFGMDVAKPMVEVAKDRYERLGNVIFLQEDVTQPWEYQSHFDGIFTSFAIHELHEAERLGVLAQSYLALKEKGRLVIADFNPQISGCGKTILLMFFKLFERENLNFFSFDQKETLEKAGFKRVRTCPVLGGLFLIILAHKS